MSQGMSDKEKLQQMQEKEKEIKKQEDNVASSRLPEGFYKRDQGDSFRENRLVKHLDPLQKLFIIICVASCTFAAKIMCGI